MITTYSTIIWLSAALTGVFSLLIYLGSNKPSTKYFSLTAFWAFIWTLGMSGYFTASTYDWILFWGRWNHFSSSILAAAFLYFCLVFPKEKLPPKWVTITILTIETILVYLHMLTDLIIRDYYQTGSRVVDRGVHFGDWGILFHIFFVGFFVAGFIILIKNFFRETDPAIKAQIKFLMFGVFAGVVPIAIINLVLGTLGNFQYYWLGAPLTLGWVSISGYVIVKHKALTVRLLVAELAVVAMALVLFSNIFFAEIFKLGLYGRLGIFLVFSIFGYFFIKSVTDAENQREWLSILSLELKDFNQNLEARVIAETKEAEKERAHIETVTDTITSGLVEYGKDMTIQRINKTAERLLGIDRRQIIGQRIEPQDAGGKWSSLASIIYPDAKGCNTCDVPVDKPIKRELQVTTLPILDGYFKMFRDVTREKIIAKSKSEFISVIAHNFKEPLSTVKTTLE
ncbi:MAG TPA: histidine kinase N-terminal 7TM domain-containing protein, partial [Candidatus Paceibacterota bacterium]|nr:histidine kinase N-terminal 7TM domain-containing protein [Candidatus Paceibacterota bacterium]